jgi:ParB family transcriptional regulator, chromosome partitioning protein
MADNNPTSAGEIATHLQGKDPLFGGQRGGPRVVQLTLSLIERNPDQPRKSFNEERLNELKTSIERHGLLQPITVKALEDGDHYLLVAGERRYRAFELLGRDTIPAIITSGDPDELALIENLQRENLNAVEEAVALARLREIHSWTQEQLGEAMGKTKSAISMTLKVLELPKDILEVETSQQEPLPKSILLEIVRVKGAKKQKELYEAARQGQMMTARAAREARLGRDKLKKGAGGEVEGEHEKRFQVQQTISMGRGFAKRLQTVSDEYLSGNQEQYAALVAIAKQVNDTLGAISQTIGEPIVVPSSEEPQAEQAA